MASKYQQLADILRETIIQHIGDKNFRLPTEMELCSTYGYSRQTIRHALALLKEEGVIVRRQGSGSYPSPFLSASAERIAAVILPDSRGYLHAGALRDIQAFFNCRNFTVRIFMTDYLFEREREILQSFDAEPPTVIIAKKFCTALPDPNDELYRQLSNQEIPIAFFNTCPSIQGTFQVCPDDFLGGYQLASYLIQHRHTRIAGIFQKEELESHQKFKGLAKALAEHGQSLKTRDFYWYPGFSYPPSRLAPEPFLFPKSYLTWIQEQCSAVLCHNDEAAYALVQALLAQGASIPGDLEVVSFDNSYLKELSPVRIPSMACTPQQPWLACAGFLHKRLEEKDLLPPRLFWQLE